jgi:transcriptional regulator with XRE-family HTH domain
MATVGERLKVARERRGLSQRELARQAKCDHAVVARLESGERASLSLLTARRFAEILGVTTDYLAGMYDTASEKNA